MAAESRRTRLDGNKHPTHLVRPLRLWTCKFAKLMMPFLLHDLLGRDVNLSWLLVFLSPLSLALFGFPISVPLLLLLPFGLLGSRSCVGPAPLDCCNFSTTRQSVGFSSFSFQPAFVSLNVKLDFSGNFFSRFSRLELQSPLQVFGF